jgi:DNA-binding response OmpR family regulator
LTRIHIIEDNADLAFGLSRTLEFEGFEVGVSETGEEGLRQIAAHAPDLVLLDVMLPGMNGFDVLTQLRRAGNQLPVLILTARGEEADVVVGFQSGADDYVTKPFSTLELVARVRALLRRAGADAQAPVRGSFGTVEVDSGSRIVRKEGDSVALTPKEFDLLALLLRHDGNVVTRSELLTQVWGYEDTDVLTRTVDIHIAELRRKLEDDPANPRHILTVRKVGYRLVRNGAD